MNRRLILTWVAVLAALFSASVLSAQEEITNVVTIPYESLAAQGALSPNDRTLALYNNPVIYNSENLETTPEESQIRLFDIATGEALGSLQGSLDWVVDIDFNADGSRLIAFHRNGDLSLWDVPNQTLLKTIPTYVYGGGWVLFMPDDQTVLLRLGEFVFGALDIETNAITRLYGRHVATYNLFSETYAQLSERGNLTFFALTASPDAATIAASTYNDEVLLWDTASGETRTLREPSEQIMRLAIRSLVFSADGSRLIYFDNNDDQFHILDVSTGEEIEAYAFGSPAFAVSPNETAVAWGERESGTIYLAETASAAEPTALFALPEGLRVLPSITELFFTSDGTKLVVTGLQASEEQNAVFVINLAE